MSQAFDNISSIASFRGLRHWRRTLIVWAVLAADPYTERVIAARRERLRRRHGGKVEE